MLSFQYTYKHFYGRVGDGDGDGDGDDDDNDDDGNCHSTFYIICTHTHTRICIQWIYCFSKSIMDDMERRYNSL